MAYLYCLQCPWKTPDNGDQYVQSDLHWAETNHVSYYRPGAAGFDTRFGQPKQEEDEK